MLLTSFLENIQQRPNRAPGLQGAYFVGILLSNSTTKRRFRTFRIPEQTLCNSLASSPHRFGRTPECRRASLLVATDL
jgi:hypothetical protein